ncbi:MAG: hypothetical protein NT049_01800, partial [Planctomycetota bacterium]|nr:hypothetical protein [Planctomycetota bacterium]
MRSIAVFASLAACLLAFPAADARGDLLDLPILKPDIMAQYIQMDYVKDAWLFTLSGEARAFDRGGGLPSLDITNNGTFSLTATVNNSGTLTGGTVTVSGEISALPPPTNPGDPLLVANLTGFEYRYNVGVGGSFAFLFESPGGSLKDYWGSKPGLILFDDMG